MAYRKPGTLLPIEADILGAVASHGQRGAHGFLIAQDLAGSAESSKALLGHGTLYKALDRMRKAALLTADWEDAEVAAGEGRPRRRVYHVTAEGRRALTEAPSGVARPELGQAPA
jgi:DNA-binding PadR family transcriptional regulator